MCCVSVIYDIINNHNHDHNSLIFDHGLETAASMHNNLKKVVSISFKNPHSCLKEAAKYVQVWDVEMMTLLDRNENLEHFEQIS